MELIKLNDLIDSAVYEFCCAVHYNDLENRSHWNANSFFVKWEEFGVLAPYLDMVFPHYHYFGLQKIKLLEWEKVKELYFASNNQHTLMSNFFVGIDQWLAKENNSAEYFWILDVYFKKTLGVILL